MTEKWEEVRDILYRAQLPRNDPGAYCPDEAYERVSKEIAAVFQCSTGGAAQECPLCPGFSAPCGNSNCPQLSAPTQAGGK